MFFDYIVFFKTTIFDSVPCLFFSQVPYDLQSTLTAPEIEMINIEEILG